MNCPFLVPFFLLWARETCSSLRPQYALNRYNPGYAHPVVQQLYRATNNFQFCCRRRSPLLDHNILSSSPIQSTTTGSTCLAIFPAPSVLIIGPGRPRFRYPLSCLPTSIFPSKRDVPSLSVLRTKRPPTMRIPTVSTTWCVHNCYR